MANQPTNSRRTAWNHTPPKLATTGGAGRPPVPPRQAAATSPPQQPRTLTEIFNHSSDPRSQVALLRAKQSRPTPSLDYGVNGSITNSINLKRDRRIQKTIDMLTNVLEKSTRLEQEKTAVAKIELGKKNQITNVFNKQAGRSR